MSNPIVKCWITRQSAFSIQCGGLERLFIHFSKPSYCLEQLSEKDRDTPFSDISEQEGLYKKVGWIELNQKTWCQSLSVGNWIGYDNTISNYIWSELRNHFHNKPFDEWHILEKEGKSKISDFCLELEVEILLNK